MNGFAVVGLVLDDKDHEATNNNKKARYNTDKPMGHDELRCCMRRDQWWRNCLRRIEGRERMEAIAAKKMPGKIEE